MKFTKAERPILIQLKQTSNKSCNVKFSPALQNIVIETVLNE